ncbi:MAG: peptidase [Arthrospira sp. PLM2.Bin9]|nr:peptidase [Arthrospira sp. PLM2.Bin9]TVU55155.1 MAG: peptidase [Arthrospira sp. PLM2.Bin9]
MAWVGILGLVRLRLIGLSLFTIFVIVVYGWRSPAVDLSIPFHPHPLPPSLEQWQDPTDSGDYFDQIAPPRFGHLVWSSFPVRVYIESPTDPGAENWRDLVLDAVMDWNPYLPIEVIEDSDRAEIQIFRRRPPLQPGNLRASSAEARYQLFKAITGKDSYILGHRFTIWLSPTQSGKYITAATRHEFGHALGIWGHSPMETDVMYYSQVREPPPISPRDVNTLRRIYEQPTQLGWPNVRAQEPE